MCPRKADFEAFMLEAAKQASTSTRKRFGMDKANPLSTPMIGRSKTKDDPYQPCEEDEEEYD